MPRGPAMAQQKSTIRTPASGWGGPVPGRPADRIGAGAGRGGGGSTSSPLSAPRAGAGPRGMRPRSDRNGEPARRIASTSTKKSLASRWGSWTMSSTSLTGSTSRPLAWPSAMRSACGVAAASLRTTSATVIRLAATWSRSSHSGPVRPVSPSSRSAQSTKRGKLGGWIVNEVQRPSALATVVWAASLAWRSGTVPCQWWRLALAVWRVVRATASWADTTTWPARPVRRAATTRARAASAAARAVCLNPRSPAGWLGGSPGWPQSQVRPPAAVRVR